MKLGARSMEQGGGRKKAGGKHKEAKKQRERGKDVY
jgi:hypothetical protein